MARHLPNHALRQTPPIIDHLGASSLAEDLLRWLREGRWLGSLLMRVVLGIVLVAILISTILFVSIDYLVTRQFEEVHTDRVQRAARQVELGIENEILRLGNLVNLLAKDTDLNNSTYYHLYLDGEIEHPQTAMNRIVQAFRLVSSSLYTAEHRLVVHGGELPVGLERYLRQVGGQYNGVYQHDGQLWVIAQSRLEYNSNLLAWLVLAEPLDRLLRGLEETYLARIEVVEDHIETPPADSARVALNISGDEVALLDVSIPDTVGHAIAEMKRLLTILLPLAAVLLALTLGLLLHWQLRPVTALSASIAAVGRGEFGHKLPVPPSGGELGELVRNFNVMSADLAKLREVERRLQHQEQLSAIGRVAARVAHDINNPLTVISSASILLHKRMPCGGIEDEYLELIRHHTDRCIHTVQALLEYGRPVRPRLQRHDPINLTAEIVERYRRQLANGASLILEAPTGLPEIEADPLLFEQMLDNLFANAFQAAPKGAVRVEMFQDVNEVLLDVIDSGPGFPAETQAHLFEPFFTTKSGGTGLGLASCLAIARAHGGDIEICKASGGRVRIHWPLIQPDSETVPPDNHSPHD